MPLSKSMKEKIIAGRYRILEMLNSVSYGCRTYLAEDIQSSNDRYCAVKNLDVEMITFQSEEGFSIEETRKLFAKEASTLYKLGEHPQIPRLLAHLEEDQEFYLVQEYIEGHSLDEEIKPGNKLQESQVVEILDEILTILAFVHQHKVIHRNIRPSNIVRRDKDGKLMILLDLDEMEEMTRTSKRKSRVITCIRSPDDCYIPREQNYNNFTTASDVYALGWTTIFALTGIHPDQFQLSIYPKKREDRWRDRVEVNPELADIIDRMIHPDLKHRYPSAVEAHQAIKEFINRSRPLVTKFSTAKILLSGLAALFVLSGVSYYFWQHKLILPPNNQTEENNL